MSTEQEGKLRPVVGFVSRTGTLTLSSGTLTGITDPTEGLATYRYLTSDRFGVLSHRRLRHRSRDALHPGRRRRLQPGGLPLPPARGVLQPAKITGGPGPAKPGVEPFSGWIAGGSASSGGGLGTYFYTN